MTWEVIVSSANEIALPEDACKALGAKSGDKVRVSVFGGELVIVRRLGTAHQAIRGIARGLYPPGYLEEERRSWD